MIYLNHNTRENYCSRSYTILHYLVSLKDHLSSYGISESMKDVKRFKNLKYSQQDLDRLKKNLKSQDFQVNLSRSCRE